MPNCHCLRRGDFEDVSFCETHGTRKSCCSECGASHWAILAECSVCERRVCDQCPSTEIVGASSVVCATCMADALQVVDRIRPDLFETVCDEVEFSNQPVSIEQFREIVECKTVDQVRKAFKQHAPIPIRKEVGRTAAEKRAA